MLSLISCASWNPLLKILFKLSSHKNFFNISLQHTHSGLIPNCDEITIVQQHSALYVHYCRMAWETDLLLKYLLLFSEIDSDLFCDNNKTSDTSDGLYGFKIRILNNFHSNVFSTLTLDRRKRRIIKTRLIVPSPLLFFSIFLCCGALSLHLIHSSSIPRPLFMHRHTLCLHLLLAIYSYPVSLRTSLSHPPFLSASTLPLSAPLSISPLQEMVSFPAGGWRRVHTVPNKEVSVWILQKYREEKEGR